MIQEMTDEVKPKALFGFRKTVESQDKRVELQNAKPLAVQANEFMEVDPKPLTTEFKRFRPSTVKVYQPVTKTPSVAKRVDKTVAKTLLKETPTDIRPYENVSESSTPLLGLFTRCR